MGGRGGLRAIKERERSEMGGWSGGKMKDLACSTGAVLWGRRSACKYLRTFVHA